MNVVELSHPLLPDFRVKYFQTVITFFAPCQAVHNLCGNDVLHVYMRKLREATRRPSVNLIHTSLPHFFQMLHENPSLTGVCSTCSSAERTAGGARAIPLAVERLDRETKRWGFE